MASRLTREEKLASLARLLAHPIRVKILALLHDQEASASDLAPVIGESLSTVAYHFKLLVEAGALELRDTRQVRGAVERTYRIEPKTRRDLDGLTAWLGVHTSSPTRKRPLRSR